MELKDKVGIVTCGARGIGEAIVRAYAAEGTSAVIADVETAAADALAKSIGPKALSARLNVGDAQSIADMTTTVVGHFDRVDILVNDASIFNVGPIDKITEADFDRQFVVNVRGLVFETKAIAAQIGNIGPGAAVGA